MKIRLLVALSMLVSFGTAYAAHITDTEITWIIYPGYQPTTINNVSLIQACAPGPGCTTAGINGDGAEYISGERGVSNCVIHISGSNPTFDATLGAGDTRLLSFNFGARVAVNTSAAQPSWATQVLSGGSFINVSHILYPTSAIGYGAENDFTTRFTSALPVSAYHLRMDSVNPLPDAPSPGYYGSFNYNDPYQTALVHVHHCPDTTAGAAGLSAWCPAGHKESWYVYPDAGRITSLRLNPDGKTIAFAEWKWRSEIWLLENFLR